MKDIKDIKNNKSKIKEIEFINDLKNIDKNFPLNDDVLKCYYCKRPYNRVYKEKKIDNYCLGYSEETEPDYTLIKIYKPTCNCDFTHLSEEEKEEEINYNLAHSGLTPVLLEKSFDDLEQTKELKQCREYAEQFIKEDTSGIALIGPVGNGKTTALACICKYLIENGYKCYFTTLSKMLRNYSKHSYDNNGKIFDKLEKLNDIDLLILDDIGRESFTETRKEIFFSIIDHLINYHIKLAFSCNPEMLERIEKVPDFKAIIDRINELCPNVIYFNGPSFRGNI